MSQDGLYLGKLVPPSFCSEKIGTDLKNYECYRLKLEGNGFIYGRPGTGKTVLCKVLVEEAILAGYPCLVIDPKGDLAQLAWPYETACLFEQREKVALYKSRYEAFDIADRPKKYLEKVEVQLLDHNYRPTLDTIKWIFTPRHGAKIPLTIVSLHLADNEEKKMECVKAFMSTLQQSSKALASISTPKFILIDEAYRFSKQSSPYVYNSLNSLVREAVRIAGLRLVISTQSQGDFGQDFIKGGNFRHFFSFERMSERYKCQVLHQSELEVIPYDEIRPFRLFPRWTLTVHREAPMSYEEFERTMRFWEGRAHSVSPVFSSLLDIQKFRSPILEKVDFEILDCLNEIPIDVRWNPKPLRQALGSSLASHEKILEKINSNKELRNYGHYHAWLDYKKIGFPITAFFVSKGKEGWEREITEIRSSPEAAEFFEIKGPKYWDVNLLGKFRFTDMLHYFNYVSSKLLKISQRGMSVDQRFMKFLDEYKEEAKQKGPKYVPEIPPEQVVSGCVSNRAFSEHPGCYIQNNTIKSMTQKQHVELRRLLEIEDKGVFLQSQNSHAVDMNSLSESIRKSLQCKGVERNNITERIAKMAEMGIVKGVYFELPWEILGYETVYYLGQFDFRKNIVEQVSRIEALHEVQEVHTIIGTYDVLVKVRTPKDWGKPEVSRIGSELELQNLILLEVTKELKTGFRLSKFI